MACKMINANHEREDFGRFPMKFYSMMPVVILILLVMSTGPVASQSSAIRGQLVLKAGTSSSWEAYVSRVSVVYDGSSFKMWYTGADNSSYGYESIGLATSTDGITWTRHIGNPVFKRGSAGQFDADSVFYPWVIHEGNQYKMWYTGAHILTYAIVGSIGYATSPDGINWTRSGAVLTAGPSGSWDDYSVSFQSVISTPSGYYMYYRGASSSGDVHTGLATSGDGVHWTRKGQIHLPYATWDQYEIQYVGGVTNLGNVHLMGYAGIPASSRAGQIGFATSTDGVNWTPYAANPVITYGNGTSWDCCGVFEPSIITVGGNYYVYYTAWNGYTDQIGFAILPSSQYPIPEYTSAGVLTAFVVLVAAVALSSRRRKVTR